MAEIDGEEQAAQLGRELRAVFDDRDSVSVVAQQPLLISLISHRIGSQATASVALAELESIRCQAASGGNYEVADLIWVIGPTPELRALTKQDCLRRLQDAIRDDVSRPEGERSRSTRLWSEARFVKAARFLLEQDRRFQRSNAEGRSGPPPDRELRRLTWDDFDAMVTELAARLSKYQGPYAIIGVSRGGLPVAVALSHRLLVRDVGFVRAWKYLEVGGPGDRTEPRRVEVEQVALPFSSTGPLLAPRTVIVADEIIDTSETIEAVGQVVRPASPIGAQLVQAAMVCRSDARPPSGIWAGREWACTETTDRWVVFPWDVTPPDGS